MKKLLYIAIAATLFVTGCSKKDGSVNYVPQPSEFVVELVNPILPATAGKIDAQITTLTDGWWVTIETGNTWAGFNAAAASKTVYGSGTKVVPIYVTKNATGAPRKVKVTFNPSFSLPPVVMELTQN